MKRIPILFLALGAAACSSSSLTVEVANPSSAPRRSASVEVAWAELAPLKGLTEEGVVVLDDAGREIPSQVIRYGTGEPQALLFQADLEGDASRRFRIGLGERSDYAPKAYGRYVPERLDDYAWENDLVAFRAYGPALETAPGEMLSTPGFDAWVKSTDTLVIDMRYKRGNYHHDYGDGMDCYKVGRTLGAGASAPIARGQLWLSGNYAEQRTLDNGPIRTTVELKYAPFEVDGGQVSLTKYISLDAGSRFNRITDIYDGDFDRLAIASGVVRHDVKQQRTGEGWMALVEAASDSKQPAEDGDIYLALVQADAAIAPDTLGHAVAIRTVRPGQKSVYWAGTGWSKGGIADMDDWTEQVAACSAAAAEPLRVSIVR